MISVVIPAYNEESVIEETIHQVRQNDSAGLVDEVIVADGGSFDRTVALSKQAGATVVRAPKGRAAQMNYAAAVSRPGNILYFLHADTWPSPGYSTVICEAIHKGAGAGCFRLSFDHSHWFLRFLCWLTHFKTELMRFGDQSLFVKRSIFVSANGFCERHVIMEDQDLANRISKLSRFVFVRPVVRTSARKFLDNGIYRTTAIYLLIIVMYRAGFSQRSLLNIYKRFLRQDKL